MDCIFCSIVRKTSPAHILWEDDNHMAFLSIFSNTPGFSVVIPSGITDRRSLCSHFPGNNPKHRENLLALKALNFPLFESC